MSNNNTPSTPSSSAPSTSATPTGGGGSSNITQNATKKATGAIENKTAQSNNENVQKSGAALAGAAEGLASSGQNSADPNRIKEDGKKIKQLKDNVQSGDLQRGLVDKTKASIKDNLKHPSKMMMNPAGSLNKNDTKNVAKGAVQYATGDVHGLAETVGDEANSIAEEGKKAKKEKGKAKDDEAKAKNANVDNKDSKKKKDEEEEEKKKENMAKNAAKAGTATAAAAKGAIAIQFAAMMKMMMNLLMAAAQAVASIVSSAIAALVQVAAQVAVAIGVSVAVAATGIVGVFVLGIVAIVASVSASSDDTAAAREGYIEDEDPCILSNNVDGHASVDASGETLENQKKIYSFFSNYGYPDEQIAGMIGCFTEESGVDATGMETIYGEAFSIGTEKTEAWNSLGVNNDYANDVFQSYVSSGWKINGHGPIATDASNWDGDSHHQISASGYHGGIEDEELYYPGIGLGQFTGPRARNLLVVAESSPEYEWYDIECQLAFMVSLDSKADWIANWASASYGDPETATLDFLDGSGGQAPNNAGWEGISPSSDEVTARQNAAATVYSDMAEWEADVDFYNTIVALAGDQMVGASSTGTAASVAAGCEDPDVEAGNGLAERMSQYCMDSKDEAQADYSSAKDASGKSGPEGVECGSELYKKVHRNICAIRGEDNYWASCDRGVCFAVLWSGADDDIPLGDCGELMSHFASCDHWEDVTSSIGAESDLLPGDILIHSGHIVMYLGTDAVQKYHPDADASWTYGQASLGDRPPAVQADSHTSYTKIYRNVKQSPDSPYVNAHQ